MFNTVRSKIMTCINFFELEKIYLNNFEYFNLFTKGVNTKVIYNNIKNINSIKKICLELKIKEDYDKLIILEVGITKLIKEYYRFKVPYQEIIELIRIRDYYYIKKRN